MEPLYKYFKPAWKSFYKLLFLMLLILVLACVGSYYLSGWQLKLVWIVAVVADLVMFFYITVKRATMSLILRDNPEKPEDQEVAFVVCHPMKPFSPNFRESIEIGLANVMHIKIGQNLMQTILGIGDVIITSSGTSAEEIRAKNIPNPQAVRDEIQVHARKYTMSNANVSASAPATNPEVSE